MKKILSGIFLAALLFSSGCSKAPATPQEQLKAINDMLSKGYEMTVNQRQEIDEQVNNARELLKAGKNEEASKVFAKVLTDLEVIAETDRFNKSE